MTHILRGGLCLMLLTACGWQSNAAPKSSSLFADDIKGDAYATCAAYRNAIKAGTEEGKYINIPVSSYFPHTGEDGFVFSPNPRSGDTYTLGSGVFDFKRTRSK